MKTLFQSFGPGEAPSPVRSFFRIIFTEKESLKSILYLAIGINFFLLAIPIGIQILVNHFTMMIYQQPTVFILIFIAIFLAGAAMMRLLQFYFFERLQRRLFVDTAAQFAEVVPRISPEHYKKTRPAELVNRFFEVVTLQKTMSAALLHGTSFILQITFGVLLISIYHPVFIVYSVLLVASFYFVFFIMGKGIIEASLKESKEKYNVASWLEEIADLPETFRSRATRVFAGEKNIENISKYLGYREKRFKIQLRQAAGLLVIQVVASLVVLAIGGYLVVSEKMTLGQLVAAELIVTGILQSLFKFMDVLDYWYDTIVAIQKIEEALSVPLESTSPTPLQRVDSHHWSFQKVQRKDLALKNKFFESVSMDIPAGSRTAILAPDGTGKSALINMMVSLLDKDEGVIQVNGVEVSHQNLAHLRDQVMIVRRVEIISGTIEDNISFGNPLTPEEIYKVLDIVGLKSTVDMLEDGINTVLFIDGRPLSTTQSRLLMIARALVTRPSTLIIDGLFDAMEEEVSTPLLKRLMDKSNTWTLIVATNKPHLARLLDQTIDLGVKS
ncbi:MAG: ATP-binding cassette domain-containing protein [Bdellovibrionales bacterium]|nr:ATP-binding cassette domain-containing protein [Bdellovibrionales bacterium]